MARCVVHRNLVLTELDPLIRCVETIDPGLRLDAQTEHQSLLHNSVVQKVVVLVQPHGDAEGPLRCRNAGDMVEMRMGEQDLFRVELMALQGVQQISHFVAGIDDDSLTGLLASQDEAILEKRRNGVCFDEHF
jgi:hypothetical protein